MYSSLLYCIFGSTSDGHTVIDMHTFNQPLRSGKGHSIHVQIVNRTRPRLRLAVYIAVYPTAPLNRSFLLLF